MPNEQSKAAQRRQHDLRFRDRWFVGSGIDIGCGNDPLDMDLWPNITELVAYDRIFNPDYDANTMRFCDDGQFDFVHSSHCLEHMTDPEQALDAWLRILKPGGFLVCTVPDWVMYEGCVWPSRHNSDHKAIFTTSNSLHQAARQNNLPIYLMPDWLLGDSGAANVVHMSVLTEHWDSKLFGKDQTIGPAECAIEFVLQKQLPEGELFRTVRVETIEED